MNENEEQVAIVPNLHEFVLAMAKRLAALEHQVARLENRLIALIPQVDASRPVPGAIVLAIGELRTRLEWLERKR